MKNRRFIIIAFVLVSAMVMGIGYAALTDSFVLSGNGVLGTDNSLFDNKIQFTNAAVSESTGTGAVSDTASIVSDNQDKCDFTVKSLLKKDEKVTFKFTVTNSSEWNALVSIDEITTNKPEYFTVTTNVPNEGAEVVGNGGTLDITVTVTLIKNTTEAVNSTYTLTFNATTTTEAVPAT